MSTWYKFKTAMYNKWLALIEKLGANLRAQGRHQLLINSEGISSIDRHFLLWDDEILHAKTREVIHGHPWWFPFNAFLHRWKTSDMGLPHTHPRWTITIVLAGKMIEVINRNKIRILRPGSIVFRRPSVAHSIIIPCEHIGKTWTLFIVGRRRYAQFYLDENNNKIPQATYGNIERGYCFNQLVNGGESILPFIDTEKPIGNQETLAQRLVVSDLDWFQRNTGCTKEEALDFFNVRDVETLRQKAIPLWLKKKENEKDNKTNNVPYFLHYTNANTCLKQDTSGPTPWKYSLNNSFKFNVVDHSSPENEDTLVDKALRILMDAVTNPTEYYLESPSSEVSLPTSYKGTDFLDTVLSNFPTAGLLTVSKFMNFAHYELICSRLPLRSPGDYVFSTDTHGDIFFSRLMINSAVQYGAHMRVNFSFDYVAKADAGVKV